MWGLCLTCRWKLVEGVIDKQKRKLKWRWKMKFQRGWSGEEVYRRIHIEVHLGRINIDTIILRGCLCQILARSRKKLVTEHHIQVRVMWCYMTLFKPWISTAVLKFSMSTSMLRTSDIPQHIYLHYTDVLENETEKQRLIWNCSVRIYAH